MQIPQNTEFLTPVLDHPDMDDMRDLMGYLIDEIGLISYVEASTITGMLTCQQYESNEKRDRIQGIADEMRDRLQRPFVWHDPRTSTGRLVC